MNYKILKVKIEFEINNTLKSVNVLIDCTSANSKPLTDVRAIQATTIGNDNMSGYTTLRKTEEINMDLFQKVAAQGYQIDKKQFDKI